MHVPFVDLRAQFKTIEPQIRAEFDSILSDGAFILGSKVFEFERVFAQAHDCRYAVAVSSGTAALHTALWALGVGPGDEVIVPAFTFIATAEAVSLLGAKPVFADVEADFYTLDPEGVEEVVRGATRAIIPVHLYGLAADMDPILEIAKRRNLATIEDACQAHLATYRGRKVGGLAAIGCFSFYPGKNLGCYGEGGAAMTGDDLLHKKMVMFRDHGSERKYYHDFVGHNYRMEAFQGAVLGVKMKHIARWTEARRRLARRYCEQLSGLEQIQLPREREGCTHVYHLFVVLVEDRDRLQKYLNSRAIATGLHYPIPLHLQKAYAHLGYRPGAFPVSERLARQCLSLPIYPEMSDDAVDYVCEEIRRYYPA